ncbi:Hypothetical protein KK9_0198 [Borreliella garinii BgVir]|uniref:Uncharacterized protein n=1 Tax=Borrelia garinii subsp. bavariensis (strain ATCC BAA-2496 / DSM 23469 / PBi) TaxID=290434 RepID=A0A7I6GVR2_BORGP|nr:hypothetical protein BG0198 [Borreliella bavariensis PBi]AEW68538.1 Hypothetical protein KK9_0198 [Borreliella garinii BgVir]
MLFKVTLIEKKELILKINLILKFLNFQSLYHFLV